MLIILIIFWLYSNFVTDGFQKENNFLLKLPYIFVFLDIIIIFVLKTDKIKRGMDYE
jgi:biopolymer transport protein ExbD